MSHVPNIPTDIPLTDRCNIYYRWYVDGVVVQEGEIGLPNDIPILNHVFTDRGKYIVRLEICNCCGCCSKEQDIWIGPKQYVERLDCLSFRFTDVENFAGRDTGPVYLELFIRDMKGDVVARSEVETYVGESEWDFGLPIDGLYFLEYNIYEEKGGRLLDSKRFVIYEFCTLLVCYKKILMEVVCETCELCDEDQLTLKQYMYQLNQFIAFASALAMNMIIYGGATNHNFYFSDKYLGLLKETHLYIDQILKLCKKCHYVSIKGNIPYKCKVLTPKPACCCGK